MNTKLYIAVAVYVGFAVCSITWFFVRLKSYRDERRHRDGQMDHEVFKK